MTSNNHLEHWLAQERDILATLDAGPGPGVATRDQIAHLNGLQQMQAMLRGELPYAAIAKTLDFLIVEVGEGIAIFQGTPRAEHLNPMGTVHGGWFATLLDSALGCSSTPAWSQGAATPRPSWASTWSGRSRPRCSGCVPRAA